MFSFVEAFPEHEHVIAYTTFQESWLSRELERRPNVALTEAGPGCEADLALAHWYPPMTARDIALLPLAKTIVYSHSSSPPPEVPGVADYWFVSPEAAGRRRVMLNPVHPRFFDIVKTDHADFRIGRHSRPSPGKFSSDFFALHEAIDIPSLTVRVLGARDELRHKTGLRHRYDLLPFNSIDAAAFLGTLDAYCYKTSSPFREACPLAILEALAAGLPVVAENRAGIPHLLRHGDTGFLCTTIDDYKQAVELLWRDPERRRSMGEAARAWALKNVSLGAYRERVERAISEIPRRM